jgi:hypothetical protein
MFKQLGVSVLALATFAGAMVPLSAPAHADRGRGVAVGVAAGIIGLGVLGAYSGARARSYSRTCYDGPRECYYKGGSCYINRYGDEVCRRGYEVCERRRICVGCFRIWTEGHPRHRGWPFVFLAVLTAQTVSPKRVRPKTRGPTSPADVQAVASNACLR